MNKPKEKIRLTPNERAAMEVIWGSDEPLTAMEVLEQNPRLKLPTVRMAMRSLMLKGLIEISDHVYSYKVLTRKYRAVVSKEDALVDMLSEEIDRKCGRAITIPKIVASLARLDSFDKDAIDRIEAILADKRKELDEIEE